LQVEIGRAQLGQDFASLHAVARVHVDSRNRAATSGKTEIRLLMGRNVAGSVDRCRQRAALYCGRRDITGGLGTAGTKPHVRAYPESGDYTYNQHQNKYSFHGTYRSSWLIYGL
jgi:hypothetical protein